MKLSFCFLLLVFSFNLYAAPYAVVVKVIGDVKYNGMEIKKGDKIKEKGLLETGAKSVLRIFVESYNSNLTMGPNSKMELTFKKKKFKSSPYNLVNGVTRWVTQGKAKYKGSIKTKTAIMGVRGTNFIARVTEALGETEIVCFDGKVIFQNRKNKNNRYIVKKGQWGGIGGRFSPTIQPPIDLPQNVFNWMNILDTPEG